LKMSENSFPCPNCGRSHSSRGAVYTCKWRTKKKIIITQESKPEIPSDNKPKPEPAFKQITSSPQAIFESEKNESEKKEEEKKEEGKEETAFDFGKILGKSTEAVAKEEMAIEEALDSLCGMVERIWNGQTETQVKGKEPWKWTEDDSRLFTSTLRALEAKNSLVAKGLNYVPEIMAVVLVINLIFKGMALRNRNTRSIQRTAIPQSSQPLQENYGMRTIDELNRLAEAEAERINRERGLLE
jgi:hypothetical protein